MTIHLPPPAAAHALHRWGSREIAAHFLGTNNRTALPEPGRNAQRLILNPPVGPAWTGSGGEWAGTCPCDHRRDASLPPRRADADTPDRVGRRILLLLALLDLRHMPDGSMVRLAVCRRRLKAGVETMQALMAAGLVNAAGSRDPWGSGNTPDSSWWWLSTAGLAAARHLAMRGGAA